MDSITQHWIITPDGMGKVDAAAAQSGLDSFGLMRAAGSAVAAAALRDFPQTQRFCVLCGPGNNGGDGYIAATALAQSGAGVDVFSTGNADQLEGDAKRAFDAWEGPVHAISQCVVTDRDVVIDAIFGAGLSRTVSDEIAAVIQRVNASGVPVIAVDLPSGISGHSGAVLGAAFNASLTVTFVCRKPGHLLLPGRTHCGRLEVVDIGIPKRILETQKSTIVENAPSVWASALPNADLSTHKYRKGHLAVFSGGALHTGAARLASMAGLRSGAGLVTLASPQDALATNSAHLTAVMLKEINTKADVREWLDDQRLTTFVLGPGFGIGQNARDIALAVADRRLVLDADGISSFKDNPTELFSAFSKGDTRLILTPHDGEFARLFPDIAADDMLSKVEKAIEAARRSHGVVILKGADTVIASPDGRAAINTNAPPWLATAGSGDVLAGIAGAHLAQGIPAYEAAASAVWRHGCAGLRLDATATAEALVDCIPPLDR